MDRELFNKPKNESYIKWMCSRMDWSIQLRVRPTYRYSDTRYSDTHYSDTFASFARGLAEGEYYHSPSRDFGTSNKSCRNNKLVIHYLFGHYNKQTVHFGSFIYKTLYRKQSVFIAVFIAQLALVFISLDSVISYSRHSCTATMYDNTQQWGLCSIGRSRELREFFGLEPDSSLMKKGRLRIVRTCWMYRWWWFVNLTLNGTKLRWLLTQKSPESSYIYLTVISIICTYRLSSHEDLVT